MIASLRWRYILTYVFLLLLTAGAIDLYLTQTIREFYQQQQSKSLTNQARLLSDQIKPLLDETSPYRGIRDLVFQSKSRNDARITVIQSDGTVIADTDSDPALMENHRTRPEVKAGLAGEEAIQIRRSQTLEVDLMYAAVPVTSDGKVIGVVRLATSMESINNNLDGLQNAIFLVTGIALVVAILLAILASNSITNPVSGLINASRQVAMGTFNGLQIQTPVREINQLSTTFNQMASQIGQQLQDLRLERAKLQAILTNMTDGVLIVDSTGNVQMINPAAARLFNQQADLALGHTLVEVVRHHQLVETWQKCVVTGLQQTTTLETTLDRLFVHAIVTVMGEALPGSFLMVFQDLTQLRRLETVRRDFVSNVSHELRTPLASLKALTETLQEGALEDPPAARHFLSRMDEEIDTLTQMVQELLELSRIESGKIPLEMHLIQPAFLLKSVEERMRTQAERVGLLLSLDCPDNLADIQVDAARMVQVFLNLVHNAIKFTQPGGSILLAAREAGETILFSVSDTGAGISPEILPRVFERFFKADRSRSGGGTGLGLSIAKHIVEAHSGRIWVESQTGQGSTFYIELPALPPVTAS